MKKIVFVLVLSFVFVGVYAYSQNPTVDVTIPVLFTVPSQPGTPNIVLNAVIVDMVKLNILAVDKVLQAHPIGTIRDIENKIIWPRPQ